LIVRRFRFSVSVSLLGFWLVVSATYRLLVFRMSLISYVLNADSGRYADALISHT